MSLGFKIRFDNQLSRMNCQTFSTGFNSGDRGGSARTVMLSGIAISTAWAPGSTAGSVSGFGALVAGRPRARATSGPPQLYLDAFGLVERDAGDDNVIFVEAQCLFRNNIWSRTQCQGPGNFKIFNDA